MTTAGRSSASGGSRPKLFGRSEPLTRLVDTADRAVETGAQMAIVSGEAGIGKTSLVNAALDQLADNGWSTHTGFCIEYAKKPLPFGPVVSILRSVLRDDVDGVEAIVERRRDDLARLLPELGDDIESAVSASLAGDVDRLLDAITGLVAQAARNRPLALLVEDIHWADAETRDLLTSLVRNLDSARVLIVVTERTGAVPRQHPLRTWLAEHRRYPNVLSVSLRGLRRADLAEQAESVLDRVPDAEFVDELVERTGGNPYFAEELLVARRAGDASLPSSLAEFLTSRLARLEEPEREVLRAVAVAGGSIDHEMLARMLPERTLADPIRSLYDASILAVDGRQYTFEHALLREGILRDALPFELSDLHRRAAEAITADPRRLRSLGDLTSLAIHWAGADDADRTLEASVTAAHAAARAAAYPTATEMALQALAVWPLAERPEDLARVSRDRLTLQAADLLSRCYRSEEAAALIDDALDSWGRDLGAGRRALLLAALAPIHWELGNAADAHRSLDQAELLLPDEVSPEAAEVHHRLSKQAVADGHIEPARAAAERAIDISRQVGPELVLIEAMTTKALALGVTGHLEEGLALAHEARGLALEAGLVSQVANTYRTEMLVYCFHEGRVEPGLDAAREGLAYAEQHCGPRWRDTLRFDLCLGLVEAGRLNEADPLLESLLSSDLDALARLTLLQAAGLASMLRDALEPAKILLDEATEIADRYDTPQETGAQSRHLAELARRQGQLDEARVLIDDALRYQLAHDNLTFTRESILEKIRITRAYANAGRPERDAMLDEVRKLVSSFDGTGPANTALRAMMKLEIANVEGRVDPERARRTITDLEGAGYLGEAAEAWLIAITNEPAPDPSDIVALQELAIEHGMTGVEARLAEPARAAGIAFESAATGASKPAADAELPHFLTAREVEVMSLLAEGLTNKGIGERLFVSPRTVSTHISNLLAKLGVANRGEAAAAYHRLGLAQVIDLRDPVVEVDRPGS